jgi:hypothetical protein
MKNSNGLGQKIQDGDVLGDVGFNKQDFTSLALHKSVVESLRANPSAWNEMSEACLARVKRWSLLPYNESALPYFENWRGVLLGGMDATIAVATGLDQHSKDMRQCSPLTCELDNRTRWQSLKRAGEDWRRRIEVVA